MPFVIDGKPYESDIHIDDSGDLSLKAKRQSVKINLHDVDPYRDRFAVVMSSHTHRDVPFLFSVEDRQGRSEPYLALDIENSDPVCISSMLESVKVDDPKTLSARCITLGGNLRERWILLYTPITLDIIVGKARYIGEILPSLGSTIHLESQTLGT